MAPSCTTPSSARPRIAGRRRAPAPAFTLNEINSPLEPFKKYRTTSFGNLENAAAAGSVHSRNPATWLSATLPTGNNMATTLDQEMAKYIGKDTPFPTLELASETTVQVAAGNGGPFTTLSFRDEHTPLPMEYNPRKVFLQLFGEGETPRERVAMARQANSMLDVIRDRTKKLESDLGSEDRAVLDAYLTDVREVERRAKLAGSSKPFRDQNSQRADWRAGEFRSSR